MPNDKVRYWILTLPQPQFVTYLPAGVAYLKGQLERGAGGFVHWQLLAYFAEPVRLVRVKAIFGPSVHAEPTRSSAANAYVWKEDTAVPGTRFELGSAPGPIGKNKRDWDQIYESAKSGQYAGIPRDVLVRSYGSIRRITTDNLLPVAIERTCHVFWGRTGTGKSRRAWGEAGLDAYPKDPATKFWDGYQGQEHVVIDEFRGTIGIHNMLRWLDRYPVIVEIKGSSVVLKCHTIWITSNLHPDYWYPELDKETKEALFRRMTIEEIL